MSDTIGSGAGRIARYVALGLVGIACLTLLFSAQEVFRRTAGGGPTNWPHTLGINALDWAAWAVLAPLIAMMARRRRVDGPGPLAARVGLWVVFGITACVVDAIMTGVVLHHWRLLAGRPGGPGAALPPLARFLTMWIVATIAWNAITFCMIAGVFHAALFYDELRARERQEAELEARLARAELNALRMQLQPHFFFNALHTISALMVSDVATAHRVIAALGDLMRSSLDLTARQEIPLREEMAFVQRYVEIQQARFRNRMGVHLAVPDDLLDAYVPSLVLQPLVENAVRHGIEPHTRRGQLWIRAAREDGRLVLNVRDDGSAVPEPVSAVRPPGIGLLNIEARLMQLYGAAHRFRAGRGEDGCFDVTLAFPFHTEPGLFPAKAEAR